MTQPQLFPHTETALPAVRPPKNWRTELGGSEFRIIRLNDQPADDHCLDNPDSMVDYLRPKIKASDIFRPDVENMIVVHLNSRKKPIGFEIISQGTIDTLLVHPREIFKSAIVANSHSIVLVHNHPSGDPTPSEADTRVTRDLIKAGELMKIELIDHIILGLADATRPKGYSSLREFGYFY